jgi:hypothetical protein
LLAGIAGLSSGVITASAFRTYHTPLNSQPDFINALKAARQFAESASQELGMQVGFRLHLPCLKVVEDGAKLQTLTPSTHRTQGCSAVMPKALRKC